MGIVETAALRALAPAVQIVAKKAYSKRQMARLVDRARDIFVVDTVGDIPATLTGDQLSRLEGFVESPQFGHLVRQAFFCALTGEREKVDSALREQLRDSLRIDGVFTAVELTRATDVLLSSVYKAIYALRNAASPGSFDSPYAAVVGGEVATAAVRNSELLRRIGSLTEINSFATKLKSQAALLNAKLRLPNVVQSRMVRYTQLYVGPTLRVLPSNDNKDLDKNTNIEKLVQTHLRATIIGDPGAGKSTLASKLVHDLATGRIQGVEETVPLLLIVRKHTQALRTEYHTLLHYLEATCRTPHNVAPPPDALEYLLLNGRITVVIDGVDELGDSSFRADFARMVDGFAHLYPLTRIVVTSRAVGYDEAALDDGLFPVVNIAPFDDAQVEKYAQQWFQLDPALSAAERKDISSAFVRESAEVSDLRSNPLMLSLLCVLYTAEHTIPSRRPEIYERCAEILFDAWDRSRGMTVAMRYRQQVRPVVQRIAWHMFNDPEKRQALPRSEIQKSLTSFLRPRFPTEEDAAQAADDFLDFCAGRAWVLTDVGSDAFQPHYGFVHRTFLEYFAASQIVKQDSNPDAVWDQLEPHIFDSTWENVTQIAIQILDRDREDGPDHLLGRLLDVFDTITDHDHPARNRRPRILSTAARSLDNVIPSYETLRKIVERCVDLSCDVPAAARRGHTTSFSSSIDSPLFEVLTAVRSPANVANIAVLVADSIYSRASKDKHYSSAGIVYYWLSQSAEFFGDTPAERAIDARLATYVAPPAAELWRRLMTSPTEADLRNFGISLLYDRTAVYGGIHYSYTRLILGKVLGLMSGLSDHPSPSERLEELYPAVVEGELPVLPQMDTRFEFELSELARVCVLGAFEPLTSKARGAALILLIPILKGREDEIRDERMRWFATAYRDSSRRDFAVEQLNEFELPEGAHRRLLNWIRGV